MILPQRRKEDTKILFSMSPDYFLLKYPSAIDLMRISFYIDY